MGEIQNSKQENAKQYDLEERSLKFAKAVRIFVKKLPKTMGNFEDGKQIVRSSGSIGANQDKSLETECLSLMKECKELMLILGSIMRKCEIDEK